MKFLLDKLFIMPATRRQVAVPGITTGRNRPAISESSPAGRTARHGHYREEAATSIWFVALHRLPIVVTAHRVLEPIRELVDVRQSGQRETLLVFGITK